MKVMLVNPPMPVFNRVPSLPLGLLSIASYLKYYGHEVKFVECLAEANDVEASIREFGPDVELKVVHHYFQWKAFASKDSVKDDSFGIIKKMAGDAINRIFRHGIKGFFYGTYVSAKQFLTVFYYSNMHRKILKKYGLK